MFMLLNVTVKHNGSVVLIGFWLCLVDFDKYLLMDQSVSLFISMSDTSSCIHIHTKEGVHCKMSLYTESYSIKFYCSHNENADPKRAFGIHFLPFWGLTSTLSLYF